MSTDNPQSVSLSPTAAVDSIAEWPLGQVVQYLRKKEKEQTERIQAVPLFCRSAFRSLVDVLDALATSYGVSRNRMSRWASYHGLAIAQESSIVTQMSTALSTIRSACLLEDDTDTLDMMKNLSAYAPRFVVAEVTQLQLYGSWVGSEYDELSRTCSVYKYRVAQVYIIKSVLSDGPDRFGETGVRLQMELDRWDTWMKVRLASLEILVERKKA
ncbi:MAG: hypothetical protein ACUZ8A_06365 [Candidatus Bathyanammoxibius sp.]